MSLLSAALIEQLEKIELDRCPALFSQQLAQSLQFRNQCRQRRHLPACCCCARLHPCCQPCKNSRKQIDGHAVARRQRRDYTITKHWDTPEGQRSWL